MWRATEQLANARQLIEKMVAGHPRGEKLSPHEQKDATEIALAKWEDNTSCAREVNEAIEAVSPSPERKEP